MGAGVIERSLKIAGSLSHQKNGSSDARANCSTIPEPLGITLNLALRTLAWQDNPILAMSSLSRFGGALPQPIVEILARLK